jgi:DNA-binding LytR/AlgR family response regulator
MPLSVLVRERLNHFPDLDPMIRMRHQAPDFLQGLDYGVLHLPGDARFAVRAGAKFAVCDPKKIAAIIAQDHYAAILLDGRELLADDSLDLFETRLNPERFVRVHRSAIINHQP